MWVIADGIDSTRVTSMRDTIGRYTIRIPSRSGLTDDVCLVCIVILMHLIHCMFVVFNVMVVVVIFLIVYLGGGLGTTATENT